MKVKPECLLCLFERGFKAGMVFAKDDYDKQLELAKELMAFLIKEFNFNQVPSWIGSWREKIVQRVLQNPDPYRELKKKSNELAKTIWNEIKKEIDLNLNEYNTFRKIILSAAVANSVEWFISGYDFSVESFKKDLNQSESKISIDDTINLWEDIKKAKKILYILDNAGEAVVDLDVVGYLKKLNKNIIVAARESPVLNDITIKEAIELGFDSVADKVIPVGWFIGVHLDKEGLNPLFTENFNKANVVIAKGMGAYESLSEYTFDKPVYVVLKAKCNPVANHLGVPRGTYVIKKL